MAWPDWPRPPLILRQIYSISKPNAGPKRLSEASVILSYRTSLAEDFWPGGTADTQEGEVITTFASRLVSCMEIEYRPPARTSDDYNHGEMVSASRDVASVSLDSTLLFRLRSHIRRRSYATSVCLCLCPCLSVAGRYFFQVSSTFRY